MLIWACRVNPASAEIVAVLSRFPLTIFDTSGIVSKTILKRHMMRFSPALLAFSLACSAPSLAASPYDGVYHGSYTWAGNGNRRCTGGDVTIRVTDGKFNYGSADSGDRVSVNVGPDGSFSAQSGQRYLQGKIQGSQLTATSNGQSCNYMWSLTK